MSGSYALCAHVAAELTRCGFRADVWAYETEGKGMTMAGTKTITVAGQRYRLEWVEYHRRVEVRTPVRVYLPAGTTFDSPGLRDAVVAAVAAAREARRRAGAAVRDRVRDGTAGLGAD